MRCTITYAITVCDEYKELSRLLDILEPHVLPGDLVLIQGDADNVTESVESVIENRYGDIHIKYVKFPLNGDFSAFKNNLKQHADTDWIFQIDADEYPTESLLESIRDVLSNNKDTEVILVPRVNTVNGITEEHINKWNWNVRLFDEEILRKKVNKNDLSSDYLAYIEKINAIAIEEDDTILYLEPVINFPDYQWRLYQNKPEIKWINKVHERLVGFFKYAPLPNNISWALMHEKDIDRQEKQNNFYDTLI